jgi:hypothetical protein
MFKKSAKSSNSFTENNENLKKYQRSAMLLGKKIKGLLMLKYKQQDFPSLLSKTKPIKEEVNIRLKETSTRAAVHIKGNNIGSLFAKIIEVVAHEEKLLCRKNINHRVIGVELYEDYDKVRVICGTKMLATRIEAKLKDNSILAQAITVSRD